MNPLVFRILGEDDSVEAWLGCPDCRLEGKHVNDYGQAYREWEITVTKERNNGRRNKELSAMDG